MTLATKTNLKIIDKNILRLYRKPRLISWLLLLISAITVFEICRRLSGDVFFALISSCGEILLILDTFGEWEDLILDKVQNKAFITRCNWSEKVTFQKPTNSTLTVKLSDIRHIGVSMNIGLYILCRNGKIVGLDMPGLNREDAQNYRKEINYFLNMSKFSHLDELRFDPYERIAISDSEDEFTEKSLQVWKPNALKNQMPMMKFARRGNKFHMKKEFLQNRPSFSSLEWSETRFDGCKQKNLKRGRYTEKYLKEDIFPVPSDSRVP